MAVLFSDSFSHYATADIARKWTSIVSSGGTPLIDPVVALPGMISSCKFTANATAPKISKTFTAAGTFVLGFWAYLDTAAGGTVTLVRMLDVGALQLDLRVNVAGNLILTVNGTTLGTTTNALSLTTWYHVELKATIDNSAGVYELRVNGSSTGWLPQATGQDTKGAGTNNSINSVDFQGPSSSPTWRLGGVYILDSTGSTCNTFLGVCRPYLLLPRAAGSNAAWTPNYADNFVNVGEPVADGDGTFNQSSTASQKDTFKHASAPAGTIQFMAQNLVARQDAGAQRTIRPILVDTGGTRNGTSVLTSASYVNSQHHWETNPRTSAAWAASDINDAAWEAGYELVS